MATPITWTPDRLDALKKHWATGASARVIAEAIGGVTRNAVLGAVHRHGLPRRRDVSQTVKRRVPTPRKRPTRSARQFAGPPKSAFKPAEVVIASVEVEPLHLKLLELQKGMCRYPYGDSQFTFCGHPADGAYCAPHATLCYQPVSARRTKGSNRHALYHAERSR